MSAAPGGAAAGGTLAVSAPARANLIGNPSDQYGGVTLACALPLRARVTLRAAAPEGGCRLEAEGERASLRGEADLAPRGDRFDWARAVLAAWGPPLPSLHVEVVTGIPRQSGVAGSTALVVALLHALRVWHGRGGHPWELAERARDVERRQMGVQCGYVDQYACVFGGLRYVDLRGKAADVDPEKAPLATVEDLAPFVPRLPFVMAFTGRSHSSDAVHRPIRERWLAGEPGVVRAYRRVAAIGREGKRALLDADWPTLGALMDENHAIQRDLGGSGDANERLIAAARSAGALGAKLAGAGDGGTVAVLWTRADAGPLERALREAGATALWRPAPQAPGVRVETPAG